MTRIVFRHQSQVRVLVVEMIFHTNTRSSHNGMIKQKQITAAEQLYDALSYSSVERATIQ